MVDQFYSMPHRRDTSKDFDCACISENMMMALFESLDEHRSTIKQRIAGAKEELNNLPDYPKTLLQDEETKANIREWQEFVTTIGKIEDHLANTIVCGTSRTWKYLHPPFKGKLLDQTSGVDSKGKPWSIKIFDTPGGEYSRGE
jgi:hypothetical protein